MRKISWKNATFQGEEVILYSFREGFYNLCFGVHKSIIQDSSFIMKVKKNEDGKRSGRVLYSLWKRKGWEVNDVIQVIELGVTFLPKFRVQDLSLNILEENSLREKREGWVGLIWGFSVKSIANLKSLQLRKNSPQMLAASIVILSESGALITIPILL